MPIILAMDTSTNACSAALYVGGVVEERFQYAPRLHGELILPMIDELLKNAGKTLEEVDAIAYGCGPGSFTGVRMAASLAQGLAIGSKKPLIAISSLLAMADACYQQLGFTQLACAFDARMGEVYWGAYQFIDGKWTAALPESVSAPGLVPELPSSSWVGVGEGWGAYAELSNVTGITRFYPRAFPRAGSIATLALDAFSREDFLSPEQALPTYLRNKVV